jgi:hypothetical protein
MKRWEARAQSVAVREFIAQTDETIDFALAYFVWAHSFREWLIEAGSISKVTLDSLLQSRHEWLVCRDLANKSRHYNLQNKPTDKDFVISHQIDLNAMLAGSPKQVIGGVFHNGTYYQFSDCILMISKMWEEVLDKTGLERGRQ